MRRFRQILMPQPIVPIMCFIYMYICICTYAYVSCICLHLQIVKYFTMSLIFSPFFAFFPYDYILLPTHVHGMYFPQYSASMLYITKIHGMLSTQSHFHCFYVYHLLFFLCSVLCFITLFCD